MQREAVGDFYQPPYWGFWPKPSKICTSDRGGVYPGLVHGYNERALVEQFRIKLSEVRQFMKGDLDAARMLDLTEEMREAGLPI